jgi:hypothetical protein
MHPFVTSKERLKMTSTHTGSRTAIARSVLVTTASGLAALAFAGPASAAPQVINKYIEVPHCTQVGSELCPQVPGLTFDNHAPSVNVNFTANANHCSDIIAHVIVDGREWGSAEVGPSQNDGGYEIPLSIGTHTIGIRAEGVDGGCNTAGVGPNNTLSAWGGMLHVEELA